jgi:hypothetical protein
MWRLLMQVPNCNSCDCHGCRNVGGHVCVQSVHLQIVSILHITPGGVFCQILPTCKSQMALGLVRIESVACTQPMMRCVALVLHGSTFKIALCASIQINWFAVGLIPECERN